MNQTIPIKNLRRQLRKWIKSPLKLIMVILMLGIMSVFSAYSQQTITGKISDAATGEPLVGVNVVEEGTTNGAISDLNGNFTITVANGSSVLVFSFIGYATQKVEVGSNISFTIALAAEASELDEVMVVAYGSQRKATVSGAMSSVTGDDISMSANNTLASSLVGKMPGVLTRNGDGRPGASTLLQIRNMGNPLVVIDGVPQEDMNSSYIPENNHNLFNNLDVNDIESITVLKDASAAIYGFRAANGVVLITTKKGSANSKPVVNINGYYGWQSMTRYPKPADSKTYTLGLTQAQQNANVAYTYTPEELARWKAGTEEGYEGFDWYDFVISDNVPQQYLNANVNGGSDRITYHMGYSNSHQVAIFDGFNFQRNNIESNVEGKIAEGLKVGTNITIVEQNRHNVGVPGLDDYWQPFYTVFQMWPTEPAYINGDKRYVNTTHNVNANPATFTEEMTGYTDDIYKSAHFNLYSEYETPIKGLKINGRVASTFSTLNIEGFEYTFDTYTKDANGDPIVDPAGGNSNPWREKAMQRVTDKFYQMQISYNRIFGNHTVAGLLGYEKSSYWESELRMHSLPENNYIHLLDLDLINELTDREAERRRQGYFAKFNYDYSGKYLLEAAVRYDGSYLFPEEHRWGLFPYVSVGWRISEESFINDNISALSNLKLRASYGQNGDDNSSVTSFGSFEYLAGYAYNTQLASTLDGQSVTGLMMEDLPVTSFSWVRSKLYDVGFDFGLWGQKLTGTFDYFRRVRTDLPDLRYDVLVPLEAGFELPPENLNSDAHYGIEGELRTTQTVGELTFSIGVNATMSRHKWLSKYKPYFSNSWQEYYYGIEDRIVPLTYAYSPTSSGIPNTPYNWGYHYIGQFQSQEQIDNYPVDIDGKGNSTILPGDLIYEDMNKDGKLDGYDMRPMGYGYRWNDRTWGSNASLPQLTYGLNTAFQYKGFELNADFAGGAMQTYIRYWEMKIMFQNNGNSLQYMLEDCWHRADPYDVNSEWIPGEYFPARPSSSSSHSNYYDSDYWLTNVKYIRLRNFVFGYNLPKSLISKVRMSNLKVYVSGTNLFSIDNLKKYEIDPEMNSGSGLAHPITRTYNIGFNVTF